ncbi:MAG: NAD-dependent epimerase/dehydratase family protein [Candidatus Thermoplasmatota archaeon]|nr:NAD-dependent epimerase/dehydratase family protein [Candidatus Thermoplasmatota archaeon]
MRLAVTGASGFIGGRLMEELAGKNTEVVGICRSRYTKGNVLDRSYLREVLRDVDLVYHCAAVLGGGHKKKEYEVNTRGTENVIEIAVENRVKRLVHLSSLAVLGEYSDHQGDSEESPYATRWKDPYTPSKIEAEKIVLMRRKEIEAYIVRPGWVWGPGDEASRMMLEMISSGKFRFIGNGSNLTYFTYIDNLLSVLLRLGEVDDVVSGEVFNITDGYRLSLKEYVDTVCQVLGKEPVRKSVPVPIAEILAWFTDVLLRDPHATRQNVAIMSHDLHFSVEKAKTLLGYDPDTDLEVQIKETARHFKIL